MSFIYVLLIIHISYCSSNVGTTLFSKADTYRECWSSESVALLTSRMILEDLLPSTSTLLIDSNEFVTDLVEYFRLMLEIVREETHGKIKHITLVALTDLLGGYLHHAVLPIAKFSYYAGLIDYDSITTLIGLCDELKWFLRTNGEGWTKPLSQNFENFEIQRITLQPLSDSKPCENLIFTTDTKTKKKASKNDISIPLPFFDSATNPSAIAFPLRRCPLHNVEANSSSYLVMNFFILTYKCLQMKNANPESVQKFVSELGGWIDGQILPRLEDEKFYAIFGGILRVRNTLQRLSENQKNEVPQGPGLESQNTRAPASYEMSRTSMILMAVLITIFIWFFLGTMFICYKMKRSKQKTTRSEDHCEKSTCPSLVSSKYFYPERLQPVPKNKKILPETDTSDSDTPTYLKHGKGRKKPKISIKACHCKDEEDSAAIIDSVHTEGHLPSITEISEQTTSQKRSSPTGSLTQTSSGKNTHSSKVQKNVYLDTETESEDTSEPG